jgi:hypothetical protein
MTNFKMIPFSWLGGHGAVSRLVLTTLLVALCVTGSLSGCNRGALPTTQIALYEQVPDEAAALIAADTLDGLIRQVEARLSKLPVANELGRIRKSTLDNVGVDLLDTNALSETGLAVDKPAMAFLWRGQLVLIASAANPAVFSQSMTRPTTERIAFATESHQRFQILTATLIAESRPLMAVAHHRGRVLMTLPFGEGPSADTPVQILKALIDLDERRRWQSPQAHSDFLATLEAAPALHGFIDPSPWLGRRQTDGHAKILLARLIRQIGRIHYAVAIDEESRKLRLSLYTPGQPAEPVMIASLGEAAGKLPQVGGLVRPGVLSVVRLSVDPEALYGLIRSTLPADQRLELEHFWRDLADELKIDVVGDVIGNVTGHFLVAVYGFEDRMLRADNPHLLYDLFRLRATREAVLIPIKSRERLEPILDVATQLSRGRLRRQVIRHTIQYAWIPDGSLEWALILHDDYVLFVDSAVAFDHAIAWERSARNLSDSLREVGLGRILEENRSGFYVDLTTLANLLAESGQRDVAAWMRPFDTMVFSTEDRHAQVEFILNRD